MHNNMVGMKTAMNKHEVDVLIKTSVNELDTIFCKAKEFFGDCADLACFLNLRGFKRKFEYKQGCFWMLSRKLIRLSIECLSVYPEVGDYKKVEIIPRGLFNNDRLDGATENNVKNNVKNMMNMWLDLEYEMLDKFKNMWYSLIDSRSDAGVILGNFVKCLFDNTARKIKYIERKIMDYESTNYDTVMIKMKDADMHDHYKDKLSGISSILE